MFGLSRRLPTIFSEHGWGWAVFGTRKEWDVLNSAARPIFMNFVTTIADLYSSLSLILKNVTHGGPVLKRLLHITTCYRVWYKSQHKSHGHWFKGWRQVVLKRKLFRNQYLLIKLHLGSWRIEFCTSRRVWEITRQFLLLCNYLVSSDYVIANILSYDYITSKTTEFVLATTDQRTARIRRNTGFRGDRIGDKGVNWVRSGLNANK